MHLQGKTVKPLGDNAASAWAEKKMIERKDEIFLSVWGYEVTEYCPNEHNHSPIESVPHVASI